jgi:hypothetical protein
MGQAGAETHLKKGGGVKKFAKGGKVSHEPEISHQANVNGIGAYPESKVRTLINDSGQKRPLAAPTGKIATMKKGGHAKKGVGLTVAIAVPMRKASGRGR